MEEQNAAWRNSFKCSHHIRADRKPEIFLPLRSYSVPVDLTWAQQNSLVAKFYQTNTASQRGQNNISNSSQFTDLRVSVPRWNSLAAWHATLTISEHELSNITWLLFNVETSRLPFSSVTIENESNLLILTNDVQLNFSAHQHTCGVFCQTSKCPNAWGIDPQFSNSTDET